MKRLGLVLTVCLLVVLSACAKSVWAPDDAVARAAYASDKAPSITLVTVINNGSGSGGHSGLIVNASQRVAYDPAGNFQAEGMAERNDVVYGMTPPMLKAYYSFHARKEWHVITQTVNVSPEVAETALHMAQENGAAAGGFCSNAVSVLLRKIPGFESVPHSLYPKQTMKNFAKLPGVVTDKLYEDD